MRDLVDFAGFDEFVDFAADSLIGGGKELGWLTCPRVPVGVVLPAYLHSKSRRVKLLV
jgi:hypothetical protein